MFSASYPAPPVTLRGNYAAAVQQTSKINTAAHSISRTVVVGAAAVAFGVSAVFGSSLLYASLHSAENAASGASTSPSWWSSLVRRLRFRSCGNDEDDDAFASATGAENLFDEEKVKARQKLPRGKAKGTTRTQTTSATIAAAGDAAGADSATLPKLAGSAQFVLDAKEELNMLANAEEVREREHYIKLMRALLQREAGVAYDDDNDSTTSSDSTDVSLNYHLATAMEGNARDELLMAFSAYGNLSGDTVYSSLTRDAGDESPADLQLNIMIKTLEYLDMSNEREKLRTRRIAMYRETGRATPVSSLDAAEGGEDDGERDGDEGAIVDSMRYQLAARCAAARYGMTGPMDKGVIDGGDEEGYPGPMGRQAQRFQSMMVCPSKMKMPADDRMNIDHSVLDRILGEGPTMRSNPAISGAASNGYAAPRANRADMMEDGWEAEDDDEEAELMAYLQQADNALHFYSREEMRRARRDPADDICIVGMDDNAFGKDDAESEWEDEMDEEDMVNTDKEDDAQLDEEDDLAAATLWSRRDKRDFERELFERIRHLAKSFTLTDAMAEREVLEEDGRKQAARKQRREQGSHSSAKAAVDPAPAAAADDIAEDNEEWEDEADWEDA
ncbi:hypothetical protein Q4I30_005551 [Leishmania utingensis]|uniref:Uncharacterized protein n=1 Tax=Leishmania utingensis TaxID=653362 RepID=A0AAW3A8A7_9TRYP